MLGLHFSAFSIWEMYRLAANLETSWTVILVPCFLAQHHSTETSLAYIQSWCAWMLEFRVIGQTFLLEHCNSSKQQAFSPLEISPAKVSNLVQNKTHLPPSFHRTSSHWNTLYFMLGSLLLAFIGDTFTTTLCRVIFYLAPSLTHHKSYSFYPAIATSERRKTLYFHFPSLLVQRMCPAKGEVGRPHPQITVISHIRSEAQAHFARKMWSLCICTYACMFRHALCKHYFEFAIYAFVSRTIS